MSELREKIDQKALAGLHRVIPTSGGASIMDAYLTSGSIDKILGNILNLLTEELDKLTVIKWELINAIDMKNAESNFTDALIDTARAQLNHTKEEILNWKKP